MDIRDLKYFYAIVEEGNISHAAKRLNIAQPPLSKQMKQLEDALGVQLFERGSRRIRLTEAGKLLRGRAEQILGLMDTTMKEITDLNAGVVGTVAIGTVTSSGAALLPKWIQKFHDLYPNVTFELWEGDGYHILELLDNRIIEIGIIRAPFDSSGYESISLPDEPLVIAMKQEGCYCGDDPEQVRLIELQNQPLIVPRRWRNVFYDSCQRVGFKPKIVCISDGILQNLLWVKLGIGMAIVPQSAAGLIYDSALSYKKIIEPGVSTQTVIVWGQKHNLSSGGRHFLGLLKDFVP